MQRFCHTLYGIVSLCDLAKLFVVLEYLSQSSSRLRDIRAHIDAFVLYNIVHACSNVPLRVLPEVHACSNV